jgi:DNA-binding response OmpR family regulator
MTHPNQTPTILIIEDDMDVADMLNAYFRIQGYEVVVEYCGADGLQAAEDSRPDIIVLDIRLPDIDGFEVAKRLRGNRNTRDVPILFLTEKRERKDRLHGLEIGGDDYITKPFDIQELRLRVRNSLSRAGQTIVRNPVTSLPEGELLDERLSELLEERKWALLLIQLDNLKIFRDKYGFIAADDAIRAASLMILNIIREIGSPQDFLGHLTAEQFVIVTTRDKVKQLREKITTRIDQSLDFFYPIKDRAAADHKENRLAILSAELLQKQGPFDDLDSLKTALLNQKTG